MGRRLLTLESTAAKIGEPEKGTLIEPITSPDLGLPIPPHPRVSELVVARLVALIQKGQFLKGSKLPPERELAELLGVSRSAVREGLAALQLAGVVTRRQGAGTTLKRVPSDLGSFEAG